MEQIDGVTKKCSQCNEVKPLEDFIKNKQCAYGRAGCCSECKRLYNLKWKWSRIDIIREQARTRIQDKKDKLVKDFGGKCKDCKGVFPNYCYDFHHIDPSEKDVNPSKAVSWSPERLKKELDKCVMLCSNCHRIRHFSATASHSPAEIKEDN